MLLTLVDQYVDKIIIYIYILYRDSTKQCLLLDLAFLGIWYQISILSLRWQWQWYLLFRSLGPQQESSAGGDVHSTAPMGNIKVGHILVGLSESQANIPYTTEQFHALPGQCRRLIPLQDQHLRGQAKRATRRGHTHVCGIAHPNLSLALWLGTPG